VWAPAFCGGSTLKRKERRRRIFWLMCPRQTLLIILKDLPEKLAQCDQKRRAAHIMSPRETMILKANMHLFVSPSLFETEHLFRAK
jgi:hypothetical protein